MRGMLSNICVSKECKCLRSVIRLVCFEEIVNFIYKLDITALGHTYDPQLLKSPTYLMYSGGSDSAIVTRDDATSSSSTEGLRLSLDIFLVTGGSGRGSCLGWRCGAVTWKPSRE